MKAQWDIENSKITTSLEGQLSNLDNIKKKDEIELFNEFYNFQHNQDLTDEQANIIKDVVKEVKKEVK